jgi:ribosomal protein S18 acetylase RimI-like enzyme
MMDFYKITEPTAIESEFIDQQIINYNLSKLSYENSDLFKDINLVVKNTDGEILAGLLGKKYYMNAAYIDTLWVDNNYRGKGLGTQLLKKFEGIVKTLNCHLIHLDTFDFQAPEFYEKNGYKIYGTLDDNPIGHKRFYYYKIVG